MQTLPVIDMTAIRSAGDRTTGPAGHAESEVVESIHAACRDVGFFYAVGHGMDPSLLHRLDSLSREFFALPEFEKRHIAMARAGRAWRGWFPVGAELTSGIPDMKEGIYFGAELARNDPRVVAGTLLHGPNLFPERPPDLSSVVLSYMDAMTRIAQSLLSAMGMALGLGGTWFRENLTADPLILFRIFRYPPVEADDERWSVGEHSDYGLLTLVAQDDSGGLEVKTAAGWIEAPPIPGSFVCNLGDMLERLTGGMYRSTPHRVRNTQTRDRLSFPFFLDPSWNALVNRLPFTARPDDLQATDRWDHTNVHELSGTYGEYITDKVKKVFPALSDRES
ncbi:MAG: 2-oxoglutarate and iron-dependent oxygenase domain-containing protein [Acidimicrobiales bacterium]